MTLGERIAALRKAKGFSQEELANQLNLSRQAVYKWESNQSTPELEKLVALSSLFEVSLDELVKGESPQPESPTARTASPSQNGKHSVMGIVFLSFGVMLALILLLLSGSFAGVIIGIPFFLCAALCAFTNRHTGLWCGWVFFLAVDLFLRYGTGLMPSHILLTSIWTAEMNYARLVVAWAQFLVILVFITLTVRALGCPAVPRDKKNIARLLAGIAVFLILYRVNVVSLLWRVWGDGTAQQLIYPLLYEITSVFLMAAAIDIVRGIIGMTRR